MILVGPECNPRNFHSVLRQVWHRFDPEDHMWLLPFAPLDTLDFTSFKMHVGSKLVIDAAGEMRVNAEPPPDVAPVRMDNRVHDFRLIEGGLLAVRVRHDARGVLQDLVKAPLDVRFVVAVSPDVRLDDDENLQWGIFTRFDPVRDMIFSEQTFVGARPVYRGIVGIDATWKEGYPKPLVMDESIVKLVDKRWHEYWR
jgi:3-polyprenyl-4-hydroxybenzoate decarboxylase